MKMHTNVKIHTIIEEANYTRFFIITYSSILVVKQFPETDSVLNFNKPGSPTI